MAGTITESHVKRGPIGVVTLACTADAAAATFPATILTTKISGKLLALETDPGATAPTNLYDITVTDAEGYDVLEGVGANRSSANTEKANIIFSGTSVNPPVGKGDVLTVNIANNSVNAALITIKLYYEGEGGSG